MSPPHDPVGAIVRAIAARVGPVVLVSARSTPWASATFVGARHRLVVDGAGDCLSLGAQLSEADIPVRGGFVADAVLVDQCSAGGQSRLTVEVLVLADV